MMEVLDYNDQGEPGEVFEEPPWMKIIDDPELRKEFRYVYREFKLGYLREHEVVLVKELLSAALQLYQYQKVYQEKGVNLNLEDTVKIMLADALSVVVASRSRRGFERKMEATTIQRVEQRELAEKKSKLRLFGLSGGSEE